jgi:hypothetical protein
MFNDITTNNPQKIELPHADPKIFPKVHEAMILISQQKIIGKHYSPSFVINYDGLYDNGRLHIVHDSFDRINLVDALTGEIIKVWDKQKDPNLFYHIYFHKNLIIVENKNKHQDTTTEENIIPYKSPEEIWKITQFNRKKDTPKAKGSLTKELTSNIQNNKTIVINPKPFLILPVVEQPLQFTVSQTRDQIPIPTKFTQEQPEQSYKKYFLPIIGGVCFITIASLIIACIRYPEFFKKLSFLHYIQNKPS